MLLLRRGDGAYQTTAIALASDILGSAVTTATYIKHRNIDLRRGWIMLTCIIGMCTVGSFAAWRAGNVVLGGFTIVAAILMWGSGDGAAALVGHRFGRHHVRLPLADLKKTWEGSAAMAGVSTVVGTVTMLILIAMSWWQCLLMAMAASAFGAYTELISQNGDDTVTMPVVNAAVLIALHVEGRSGDPAPAFTCPYVPSVFNNPSSFQIQPVLEGVAHLFAQLVVGAVDGAKDDGGQLVIDCLKTGR